MSEFWEPWQPKVGDRVRIRVSAECQVDGPPGSPAGDRGQIGHVPDEDGLLGVVIEPATWNPYMAERGHPYVVRRDVPILGYRAGHYAAVELEPIQ